MSQNCGGCGNVCPSGEGVVSSTCSNGACQVTCASGECGRFSVTFRPLSPVCFGLRLCSGFVQCYGTCYNAPNCSVVAPFSPNGMRGSVGVTSSHHGVPVLLFADMAVMEGYFLLNINIDGKGGVVASPSTTQPDYYYHWQRDGAISMNELMGIRTIQQAETQLQAYVGWVRAEQFESDPNGIDVRGEPKFFLPDGAVYNGGACLSGFAIFSHSPMLWTTGKRLSA
jgi:hypothetical protein